MELKNGKTVLYLYNDSFEEMKKEINKLLE